MGIKHGKMGPKYSFSPSSQASYQIMNGHFNKEVNVNALVVYLIIQKNVRVY